MYQDRFAAPAILVVCLACAAPLPPAAASAATPSNAAADRAALTAGVREIAAPGLPGSLCVFGDGAFPVVVGKAGRDFREPVVVAGRLG